MTIERTVLLLGAGASRGSDYALPTMKSFFLRTDLEAMPALGHFLSTLYPDRNEDEYNLEEVLAFLDLARSRVTAWGLSELEDQQSAELLYRDVIEYVRDRLTLHSSAGCSIHTTLFEKLAPHDSVITLNYDVIADFSLRGLSAVEPPDSQDRPTRLRTLLENVISYGGSTPPSLSAGELTGGHYLKLHGSLGWLTCANTTCYNSNYIFVKDGMRGMSQQIGRPCRYCGNALVEFIVPPVATKRVQDQGRLALLWNLALTEMKKADRIGIVGVSMAPSDFELRWLVRQALYLHPRTPLRIDIVDPVTAVRQRIRSLLPRFEGSVKEYDTLAQYAAAFPR